jgi:hypothetical protein
VAAELSTFNYYYSGRMTVLINQWIKDYNHFQPQISKNSKSEDQNLLQPEKMADYIYGEK